MSGLPSRRSKRKRPSDVVTSGSLSPKCPPRKRARMSSFSHCARDLHFDRKDEQLDLNILEEKREERKGGEEEEQQHVDTSKE